MQRRRCLQGIDTHRKAPVEKVSALRLALKDGELKKEEDHQYST